MNIAINILPLKTAHKDRGIGYYTKNLIEFLKKDPSITIQEFTNIKEVKHTDVVHYPWFDLFFHTLPIRKTFPTIATVHDVIPLKFSDHYPVGLRGKLNFQLQKLALGNCRHILTDSKRSKDDIANYLKIKNEKISPIYLAANNEFRILSDTELLRFKRKLNLSDEFILYVGDANWVKNLPFLIEGFNEIIRQSGFSSLKLVLIGGVFLKKVEDINHPELESLKQVNRMIDRLHLEGRIIRPGNITTDELVAFYNLASVYVQPSLYEGFGLSVLEALSCGTPVVCSDRGSLPEVGGEAVVYFDPTNLRQFVLVMIDVLENKSLQSKLSNLGLKRAENFSWEKLAEQTKQVYSQVLTQ